WTAWRVRELRQSAHPRLRRRLGRCCCERDRRRPDWKAWRVRELRQSAHQDQALRRHFGRCRCERDRRWRSGPWEI
ncbi:hypothetical protein AAVH_40245, partial [Aphelenchoides avenae]